jgi:protein required for attachment to host cells
MQKIPAGTWVVVADGRGARLFRNVGDELAPKLHQDELFGLDPNDEGPSGAEPKERTERQLDEAGFAKQLAERINAAVLKHEFEHLVLFADPTTLGRVRQQLHKEAQARLIADVAKDYTNSPIEEIEQALR